MIGVRHEPGAGVADAAPSHRPPSAWRTHTEDPGTPPGPQYEHRHKGPEITVASLGVEAPDRPGARSAHTASM